jgi:glycosyltransferase involved in cell wall biosynthesis
VTFAGFLNQSEIVQAYVAADCLVLPSDAGETWGLVVNEAMASGRPALVSDLVGCAEDLIEPQVTGDRFVFGDWNALADQLIQYGSEPAQLRAMGTEVRSRIQSYSSDAAAEGMYAAVVDVLGRVRATVH